MPGPRLPFNKLNQSLLLGFAAEAHSCCCRIGSRLCSCSRRVVLAAFARGVQPRLHLHRLPLVQPRVLAHLGARLLALFARELARRQQAVRALVRGGRARRRDPRLLARVDHIIVAGLRQQH